MTPRTQLTNVDVDKVRAWIDAKCKDDAVCPLCHKNEWTLIPEVVNLPCDTPLVVKSYIPSVCIACKNCGYIYFLSATIIGLVEPEAEGSE